MLIDNKEAAFKYVSRLLFQDAYNSVHKEFRSNILLTKLTSRSVNMSFQSNVISLIMPDVPNSRWEVYACSHIHLNNVLQNEFDWVSLHDVCNSKNIVIDIFDNNGVMIPKACIYIKMARTGYYVLAIRKEDILKLQVNESELYINLYVDSNVPNDVTITSYVNGYHGSYQDVTDLFSSITDYTKYKLFVDGYYIEPVKFLSSIDMTKHIEIVHDENIFKSAYMELDPRETYASSGENLIKDVLYMMREEVGDSFLSYDSVEMYVIGLDKGVILPFNFERSVSQLTNNFFGVTSLLIDACKTFLDDDVIKIKVLWKKFDERSISMGNGYELPLMNSVFSDEEIEKFISDEHLPNLAIWKGDNLEKHPFNDFAYDNVLYDEFNDTNLRKQIKALGYANFIGTITGIYGEVIVGTTTIETLVIDKGVLFTGVNVMPLLYVNGVKLDHDLYSIANTDTEVHAVFDTPYPIVPGTKVKFKLLEKEDAYGEKFIPTVGNHTVTIPNDGPIVIYAKEAVSSKGPNGIFDYGFTEIATTSPLVGISSNTTEYTITFDPALFDKEIHIFYTNKRFVVNRFEVDIDDGKTIAVEPYFIARGSTDRLPIKYSDSFEVYLNGMYLVPDLDFTIRRSTCDDPDIVGEFFITIANMEYLKHGVNLVEVYGTDHHVLRRDTTYIVDNKTKMTLGNFKMNRHTTMITVNGKLIDFDELSFNKGYYDISYPNGSILTVTTSVPRNIRSIYSSYEYLQYEAEIDELITYLMSLYQEDWPDMIVVPDTHTLYSPYLNTVINLLLDGTIVIPFANTIPDLLNQLQDWEFLKDFDITFQDPNEIDRRFVDIYPGYLADRFTDDMGLRLIIDRLMNYYLNEDHVHDGHVVYRDSTVIGKPSIVEPANGATYASPIPHITGSPFTIEDHFYGEHTSSDWQIATDVDFTNIVWERMDSTTDLTSVQVNVPLPTNTLYYVRCRYHASTLSSRWSNPSVFTQEAVVPRIMTPTIAILPNNGVDVPMDANIEGSEYLTIDPFSGPHTATDWQISTISDFSSILVDISSTTNLTELGSLADLGLVNETTYYVRYRYVSSSYKSEWSAVKELTTEVLVPTIVTPHINNLSDGEVNVNLNISIASSVYDTVNLAEPHLSTDWQISKLSDFSTIEVESLDDTVNLTSFGDLASLGLLANTRYYVRCRYKSNSVTSDWCYTIEFKTGVPSIEQPSILAPSDGTTGITDSFRITSSPYVQFNHTEPHLNSDWQIATDDQFNDIKLMSSNDTVNKLSLDTIRQLGLLDDTTYYVRVRYNSEHYFSEWSDSVQFETGWYFTRYPSQKLVPSDGTTYNYFGAYSTISEDQDVIVIGSYGAAVGVGEAYVFKWNPSTDMYDEFQTLDPPTGSGEYYYGRTPLITSDNSTIFIAALDGSNLIVNVYVWDTSSYVLYQTITAPNSDSNGRFLSITPDGSTLLVGTPDVNSSTGAVSVYRKDVNGNYVSSETLIASNAATGDNFGYTTDISDDGSIIVVGAHKRDTPNETGAAYYFKWNSSTSQYEEKQMFTGSDISYDDMFGSSLSLSGNGETLAVGAYGKDTASYNAGVVYIFNLNTGSDLFYQTQRLLPSKLSSGDVFGKSLQLDSSGKFLVVSSQDQDSVAYDAGIVFMFKFNDTSGNFEQTQIMEAFDEESQDHFGSSVSMSNDARTVLIGSYQEDEVANDTGAAYVFRLTTPPVYVGIATPNITVPVDNTEDIDKDLIITSSAYATSNIQEPHLSTDWQIATDSQFIGRVYDVQTSSDLLTIGKTIEQLGLDEDTNYYVRVRYRSDNYVSEWSTSVHFKTKTYLEREEVQQIFLPQYLESSTWLNSIPADVSDDGSILVIGATNDSSYGPQSGKVFIYKWDSSINQYDIIQELYSGDAWDHFGRCLRISKDGTTLFVGCHLEDANGTNSGAVYIYNWNSVSEEFELSQELFDTTTKPYQSFGFNVACSDDNSKLVVGSPGGYGSYGDNEGHVSVFEFNSTSGEYEYVQTLVSSDLIAEDGFGQGVTNISGDGKVIIVGAPYNDNVKGTNAGALYVFRLNESSGDFEETAKLLPISSGNDLKFTEELIQANYSKINYDGSIIYANSPNEVSGGRIIEFHSDVNGDYSVFTHIDGFCSVNICQISDRLLLGDRLYNNSSGRVTVAEWNDSLSSYELLHDLVYGVSGDYLGTYLCSSSDSKVIVGVAGGTDYPPMDNVGSIVVFRYPDVPRIETPKIASPTMLSQDATLTSTITGTQYNTINHTEPHESTDWQLATDRNFTNIIYEANADTTNLTSIGHTVEDLHLTEDTEYFVRCRYRSTNLRSVWSVTSEFRTELAFPREFTQQILPADVDEGDIFGYNLLISEDAELLIAGTPKANIGSDDNAGKVHVFEWNSTDHIYDLKQVITRPTPGTNNYFGGNTNYLSYDKSTLFICAYPMKSIFIYKLNSSTGQYEYDSTITHPDSLGRDIIVSRDLSILINSDFYYNGGTVWAYKFNSSTGEYEVFQTITSPLADSNLFGGALAINSDGSKLVIRGCVKDADPNTTSSSNTYIYDYDSNTSSFVLTQTVSVPDPEDGWQSSGSLVINEDGSKIIAGIPGYDGGYNSGKIDVIEYDGSSYVVTQTIEVTGLSLFGAKLDATKDLTSFVTGTKNYETPGHYSGIIHSFKLNSVSGEYELVQEFTVPNGVAEEYLGEDVCISEDGKTIIGGAPMEDFNGVSDTGSVYVWKYPRTPNVATPTITTPSPYSDNSPDVTIVATPYEARFHSEPHENTDWQIASDREFTNIVYESLANTVNLTSLGSLSSLGLSSGTYYIRCKYHSTSFSSTWSMINEFNITEAITTSKLVSSNTSAWAWNGWSSAISGDSSIIVSGAPYFSNGTGTGTAFVFKKNESTGNYDEIQQLAASDTVSGEDFGKAIAASNDVNLLVIGNPGKNGTGTDQGAAYVFKWNSGTNQYDELQKLTASVPDSIDYFGSYLAMTNDGLIIAVGALGKNNGAIYIFKWNPSTQTYIESQIIEPNDIGVGDEFGKRLDISGDGSTLIAGSPMQDGSVTDGGAAYVFKWNSTTGQYDQAYKLYASDITASDRFGSDVSVSDNGEVLLVGSPYNDSVASDAGKAYVFRWNSGTNQYDQTDILTTNDGASTDNFGLSLRLSGDGVSCIIASPYKNNGTTGDVGEIYLFKLNSVTDAYEETLAFTDEALPSSANLGWNVDITDHGEVAIAGAYGDLNGEGSIYVIKSPPDPSINTPVISSPADTSVDVSMTSNITSTTYATTNLTETHNSTDWQIATDILFTNLVYTSNNNVVNKTSLGDLLKLGLHGVTSYYVRVRYRSDNYVSDWSTPVNFTTEPSIATPSITVPMDGEIDVYTDITFSGDGYVQEGHSEPLTESEWQYVIDMPPEDFDDIETSNTTDLQPMMELDPETTYYVRVRYKSTSYTSAWSNPISFTTRGFV